MTQIGRYQVLETLGQGAMGVVYKAHDPMLDRTVAVKVVATDRLGDEERAEYLERFTREARAAARCTHRGIVAVHDFSDVPPAPFIVMELVAGHELGRLIRARGAFFVDEAVAIMTQMLDALGHAHALGIVHRDIKPANVLVLADGSVKIADFGVARLGDLSGTQTGAVIGTPRYMAPEQARGLAVDHRADLFAAAALFHEMLAGSPAFAASGGDAVLARVLHGEPDPLDPATLRAHPWLDPVLRRGLAKDPAQRFQSAAEFAASLRAQEAPAADATRVAPRAAAALAADVAIAAEKALTPHIGPIARVVVRRALERVGTEAELYAALAEQIPDPTTRSDFLRRHGGGASTSGARSASTGLAAAAVTPVSAEAMRAAQEALTFFVGPIARVLVKKAADSARSTDGFYEALLAHVGSEDEKAAFRRRLKPHWDPRVR